MSERKSFYEVKYQWMELLDEDLSISDASARVGRYIARFVHRDSEKAWPSYQTIADGLGRSAKSIQRAIKELEAQGWFDVARGNGYQKSTVYHPTEKSIIAATIRREKADNFVALRLLEGGQKCPETLSDVSNQPRQNCPPTKEIYQNKNKRPQMSVQEGSVSQDVFIAKSDKETLRAWQEWLCQEGLGDFHSLRLNGQNGLMDGFFLPALLPPADEIMQSKYREFYQERAFKIEAKNLKGIIS